VITLKMVIARKARSLGKVFSIGKASRWEACSLGGLFPGRPVWWKELLAGKSCPLDRVARWEELLAGRSCSLEKLLAERRVRRESFSLGEI
jgi:hypothetical protein